MGNKLEIGKAVCEKINSLDKIPNNRVWEGIEMELNKKKKRRIAFFWIWFTPFFLIGTTVIFFTYNENNSENFTDKNKPIIDLNETFNQSTTKTIEETKVKIADKNDHDIEIDSTDAVKEKQKKNSNSIETFLATKKNKRTKTKLSNTKNLETWNSSTKRNNENSKSRNLLKNDTLENNSESYSEFYVSNSMKKSDSISAELKSQVLDSITKDKKIKLLTKNITKEDSTKLFKNWEVDSYLAPTIYNTFSNKSSLDSRLNNASKKSEITLSYGLGLTVNVTEKIAIRLGYEMTNFKLATSNAEVNITDYSFIDYNKNTSNQTIFTDSNNAERMDIKQNLSYTRIPLELRYTFIPNKIGITGIGGFSYMFVSKNEVSIETNNGFNQQIGKTGNLSKMGLSANIGIGIDYKLNNRLKIIIEPIFDYQLKTFENSSSIKPYSFTIRTGLRYKFNK